MLISVIAWDANFRESLHTIDFFSNQSFDQNQYEFIWVDFYSSNETTRKKIGQYSNMRLVTLDNSTDKPWHLGKCINQGAKLAKGELLIIPDGDIAVDKNFLMKVFTSHQGQKNLVTYHRRYDEPQNVSCKKSKLSIEYLKANTKLLNPTNYAGCLALRKKKFFEVNGYETHPTFSGPGINGMEAYYRFRNAGYLIKWEPDLKIYHPWHPSSGNAGHDMVDLLKKEKINYSWLIPYGGVEQSWIVYQRQLSVATQASETGCDQLLNKMPSIPKLKKAHTSYIRNILLRLRR